MSRGRLRHDINNDGLFDDSGIYIFDIDPIRWNHEENHFEQWNQTANGNHTFYTCGDDDIDPLRNWQFLFYISQVQYNFIRTNFLWTRNDTKLKPYAKFDPEFTGVWYPVVYLGTWEKMWANRLYDTVAEKFLLPVSLKEIRI